MASPLPPISRQEVTALVRQIQGNQLFNRQLSSICQVNGIKSTGVKADLQRRIVDLIQETVNANDSARFHQISQSIANAVVQRGGPAFKLAAATAARSNTTTPSHSSPPSQFASPISNSYQQRGHAAAATPTTNPTCHPSGASRTPTMPALTFRPSPFYQLELHVSTLRVCEVMSQHRNSISIPLKLNDHPALQRCIGNKSYRVMIFCASESSGVQDITFPHQSELKVNGAEIKANMRGLKNKPGSTRPVDITHALRLKANHVNTVEFTYALTTKKFHLIASLCKITSVPDLVTVVSTRRRIPKESVVAELNKKAQDPDVVATSQVLSLKCPLSYMRLEMPCRSLSCVHVQCFDATSYLQLQEQGPQWMCPICNKFAPFEQLAVDDYVRDILENTPKDLETVTIEPNGRWLIKSAHDDHADALNGTSIEEDLIEIEEPNAVGGRRMETPNTGTPSIKTPISSGRDGSASMPRGIATTSAKRPAPAVIDLTGDSDDESPQPPRKRQNKATNGAHGCNGSDLLGDSPVGFR